MARKAFLYCRPSVRGIYKLISDYFSGGRASDMGTWCFVIGVLLAWTSWRTNILVAGDLICYDAKDTSLCCASQASHDEAYTDGSKVNERVGAAAVINCHFRNGETTCRQLSKRLPDNSTIFAAEVAAITIALNYYRRMGLLWLNILFAGNWHWSYREPFYLPYHELDLVIEWQGHTCSFLLHTK